ncbi:MAG TPA: hypothetical protein ENI95_05915 [Chloroflexi bacterium]|nr:hypothetical protein [Chloroflexota bacterium]
MTRYSIPESQIRSRHRFKRPAIRLWLPVTMLGLLGLCGWLVAPRIRLLEFVVLLFLLYVTISALVAVAEIAVIDEGLLINRLLLPERFVPWSAIDRVVILSHGDEAGARLEIASIGIYEGLSPLNRLPGLVYGQGFRQTIIITPDALEDYETLIEVLMEHCAVIRREAEI